MKEKKEDSNQDTEGNKTKNEEKNKKKQREMEKKQREMEYEEIKKKEQQELQSHNLIEEVSEIINQCVKCGMCKSLCPVFKIIRQEDISPRGHTIILTEKIINKSLYECTLCKACEEKCPLDLKICEALVKAREALVIQGIETDANKEMIKNIRETGNPFGKDKEGKDGKLYCC